MERRLLFVLGFTAAVLVGFLLVAALPTMTGRDAVLRMVPVDPTDLFAGEYMNIAYEISTLGASLPNDGPLRAGETVYVALSEGGVAEPVGYGHRKPAGFFIKGTVEDADRHGRSRVTYGIERFYVPERSGRDVRIDRSWTARVKIDAHGNARVVALLKDGTEVTFSYSPAAGRR